MAGKRDLSTAREWGREILKTNELEEFTESSQNSVLPVLDTTQLKADAQPRKMSISGIVNTAIQAGIVDAAGTSSASGLIFEGELAYNGGIDFDNTASGLYTFKGAGSSSAAIVLNCEVNTHGVTLQGPPHSAGATYLLVLPENQGAAGQALKNDGSGNLYWG